MGTQPDLFVYDHLGRQVAILEIKNKRGTTSDWAAQFRRNIAARGLLSSAEFFLIVTPDHLYLWKGIGDNPALIPPHAVGDGKKEFEPYIRSARLDPESLGSMAFEFVVSSWLGELMWWPPVEEDHWLRRTGFLDAVKDGRIYYPDAA